MAKKVKIIDSRTGAIKIMDERYAKTLVLLKKAKFYNDYPNKEKIAYKKTEINTGHVKMKPLSVTVVEPVVAHQDVPPPMTEELINAIIDEISASEDAPTPVTEDSIDAAIDEIFSAEDEPVVKKRGRRKKNKADDE